MKLKPVYIWAVHAESFLKGSWFSLSSRGSGSINRLRVGKWRRGCEKSIYLAKINTKVIFSKVVFSNAILKQETKNKATSIQNHSFCCHPIISYICCPLSFPNSLSHTGLYLSLYHSPLPRLLLRPLLCLSKSQSSKTQGSNVTSFVKCQQIQVPTTFQTQIHNYTIIEHFCVLNLILFNCLLRYQDTLSHQS